MRPFSWGKEHRFVKPRRLKAPFGGPSSMSEAIQLVRTLPVRPNDRTVCATDRRRLLLISSDLLRQPLRMIRNKGGVSDILRLNLVFSDSES